jgi:hypothetical protein
MKKFLVSIFQLLITGFAFAQPSVEMTATPQVIGKDGYFTLRITISETNHISDVVPPSFDKFIVLNGPVTEENMTTVNGNTRSTVGVSFVLKPRSTGKISIEPARVKLGNSYIKSNPLLITVVNKNLGTPHPATGFNPFALDPAYSAGPRTEYSDIVLKKGEDLTEKINRNIILQLETDKKTCYVGEPIVAEYKLYSRLKSESRLTRNPSFNGFSVVDITNPNISNFEKAKLNGREFNVYSIRKAQLYPLQDGEFTLESAELNNDVQFVREAYLHQKPSANDPFGDFQSMLPADAFINQSIVLHSKPVTITVKPLPLKDKPANFTGAVGDFNIESAVEKDSFGINESGKILINIEGSGNLQLVTAPKINWPEGIEAFDPDVKENISKQTVPLSGSKNFYFGFTVNRKGEFEIPPVSFSYFDPKTETYKTVRTKPVKFVVGAAVQNPLSVQKKTNAISGINRIFYHREWIIAVVAMLAITGLFFWIRTQSTENNKPDAAEQPAPESVSREAELFVYKQNPLEESEACLYSSDCPGFYSILYQEFKQFLSYRLKLPSQEINQGNIQSLLDEKNIPNGDSLKIAELLREIELLVYTPFEKNESMKSLFDKTFEQIERLKLMDLTAR